MGERESFMEGVDFLELIDIKDIFKKYKKFVICNL
jgi:hypothetical protein